MLSNLTTIFQAVISFLMTILVAFVPEAGLGGVELNPEDYVNEDIQNVIYLIGDGMGPLHLEKTKDELGIELTMDIFPYQGYSMTRSASNTVTDSAAGGTALATGTRTYNGAIGVYMYDPLQMSVQPKSITELCQENGMKTGVITTDSTSGATPASFTVHSIVRQFTWDIDRQQLSSDFDLIWGAESDYVTKEKAEANGFTYVTTYSEMMALESGERSFAQFTNSLWYLEQADEETPNLEQMAMKAIDLLDDGDEGFFLMIEGAHIDKRSHSNDDAGMTEALAEFDRTVAAVLEYAENDGHTLVVITADHETGAITQNDDGSYSFTQTSHSAANVPVLVYGSDVFMENGEIMNNYEIPRRIAYTLGFAEDEFPFETSLW